MLVIRPAAVLGVDARSATHTARDRAAARLGRAPRRGPDRARDLRALLGRAARGHDLQRRLLRRRRLDDRPGHDARVGRRDGSACSHRPRPCTRRRSRSGTLSKLDLVDFAVAGDHAINGSAVRELGLPQSALIAVDQPRRRHDPAARQHGRRARRPSVRARPARELRADLEDVFSRWRRRVSRP